MNLQNKKIPLSRFRLIKKATMDDFKYISEWLKDAYENRKKLKLEGYRLYYNLDNFIIKAFKEQRAFVLRYEGKAVAFLTFMPLSEECIRITFDAVCVKPDFLRMGLATFLHKSAIEHYRKRGCLVAELWNVCPESYKLGKSMGFVEMEKKAESDEKSMVKILVDTRRQNRNANVRFVVWDNCCGDTNAQPIYSWSLSFQRDKKPTICPVDPDWEVGIIQDNKVACSGVAKSFSKNVLENGFCKIVIEKGFYLYINEEKAKCILESTQRYCHT